jgi:hypothetical protein
MRAIQASSSQAIPRGRKHIQEYGNAYYSPANTFMNGDPYGGPYTHNTDFSVPVC